MARLRAASRLVAWAVILLGACSGPAPASDAGARDGGRDGSSTVPCEREADCEDGLFCTEHRCRPGDPAADARGCVLDDGPCTAAQTCDEARRECVAVDCTERDADGDGHDSTACGGDDCADDDANRYPGNVEVCDPEGHDEDCDPSTLAGATDGDADGDGEVASACCNGGTCGTDCDDANAAVNAAALEQCNGVDDDCSGTADDAPAGRSLCPGGSCSGGRCSFTPWDRIFGGAGNDFANAICSDSEGNLYVTGLLHGGADFGAGPVDWPVLASYTASGTLRWVLENEAGGPLLNEDVACDRETDRVYLLSTGTARFGSSSASGPFVAAFDTAGAAQWIAPVPGLVGGGYRKGAVAARGDLVVVASAFSGSFDPGDGTPRTAAGSTDGYVYALNASGALAWMRSFGGVGARTELRAITIDESGSIYAAGDFDGAVDFGDGAVAPSGVAIPVISLDATGSRRWARVFDSIGVDSAEAIGAGDMGVYVAGTLGGPVDFGGGAVGDTYGGFLLALAHDGSYRWERAFDPSQPLDVEVVEGGGIWVVGTFAGTVNFGGGGLSSYEESGSPTEDAFMVLYGADRTHLRDRALGEGGRQEARAITVGPGGSTTIAGSFSGSITFTSGRRTSPGGTWGFVARTAD